jgi:hypothetical protein
MGMLFPSFRIVLISVSRHIEGAGALSFLP